MVKYVSFRLIAVIRRLIIEMFFFFLLNRRFRIHVRAKCMQGVCIIARRMTEDYEPLLAAARSFRSRYGDQAGEIIQLFDEWPPQTINSYQRIGLV